MGASTVPLAPPPVSGTLVGPQAEPPRVDAASRPVALFYGPEIDPAAFPPCAEGETAEQYQQRLHDVGARMEAEFLDSRGAGLASYGPFDPSREPVVLVHGVNDSPGDMMAIAERLCAEGRQVLLFFYDDRHSSVTESAVSLAHELCMLRGCYPRSAGAEVDVDIVAHSLGGIVTRATLTTLGRSGPEPARRAGFSHIDVTTLDTPWGGSPRGMPEHWGDLFDEQIYADMDAGSAMFRELREVPLPRGVSIHHVPATQAAGKRDRQLWLEDLTPEEISFVARALRQADIEGFPFERAPGPRRYEILRNFILMMREDRRFSDLRAELAALPAMIDGATALAVIHRHMQPIATSHRGILFDACALDATAREVGR